MKKMQLFNLVAFCGFIALLLVFSFLGGINFLKSQSKPWQYESFVPEDSLSVGYLQKYAVLEHRQVLKQIKTDSSKGIVHILVDAWGVSKQDSLLDSEFLYFENLQHRFVLHKRLANRNKHAEMVELRHDPVESVFIFGGDSLEYNRAAYIPTLGFSKTLFCNNCHDSTMAQKLDSLLSLREAKFYAWTTQSSRVGNLDDLHKSLEKIANLTKKYPEYMFVIQGTHRPILGSPETRKLYHPHWVPAVIVN